MRIVSTAVGVFLGLFGAECAPSDPVEVVEARCTAGGFTAATMHAENIGNNLVLVGKVEGHPVRLLIDSGSNPLLILWRNIAVDLGLRHRSFGAIGTVLGPSAIEMADVARLDLEKMTVRNVEAVITAARKGVDYDGILGAGLLFALDFAHLQPYSSQIAYLDAPDCEALALLTLFRRLTGAQPGRPHVTVVPTVTIGAGYRRLLTAPLRVGDVVLTAIIDTGMNVSAISRSGLARVESAAERVGTVPLTAIDGRTAQVETWRFPEVRFGPLNDADAILPVVPDDPELQALGVEAIIGGDILFSTPLLISARRGALYILTFSGDGPD